jgi:hypothetical protein
MRRYDNRSYAIFFLTPLSAVWEVAFGSAGVVRQFAAIKANDIESLFGLSWWESPVH